MIGGDIRLAKMCKVHDVTGAKMCNSRLKNEQECATISAAEVITDGKRSRIADYGMEKAS